MSWSKRINHPSEVVKVGDSVEVVVLDINKEKQEISLGMKQADGNPWDEVDTKFPAGTVVEGTVRNLTGYGAFVEIADGIDGLLHVSDMSWTKKIANPAEVLEKGTKVKALVLSVDKEKKRIALGMKQLELDPWQHEIAERFNVGTEHTGEITKVTNFGVFVALEKDLEGLLHISELTPTDHLQPGAKVKVKVLRIDRDERKIGLTLVRGPGEAAPAAAAEAETPPPA
jgi:small subunit ribosomal protein S1